MYMCVCVCAHICVYSHVCICVYVYIYIHIYNVASEWGPTIPYHLGVDKLLNCSDVHSYVLFDCLLCSVVLCVCYLQKMYLAWHGIA